MHSEAKAALLNRILRLEDTNLSDEEKDIDEKGLIAQLLSDEVRSEKFSEGYIRKQVRKLLENRQEADKPETALQHFDEFITELETYTREQIVYVPIFGIQIEPDVEPLTLGEITIKVMNETMMGELEQSYINPVLAMPQNQPSAPIMLNYIRRITGLTCAEYRVVAETGKARERAEQAIRLVLDLFRYAYPFTHGTGGSVAIGLQGEVQGGTRTTIVIPSDKQGFDIHQASVGLFRDFHLSKDHVETMQEIGVFDLSDVLKQRETDRTEIDNTLLHGIHWFANAQSELEIEYRFLSLMICLEMFLSTDPTVPVTNEVSEGVAFILGTDLAERQKIKGEMKNLYRKRSDISHGRGKVSKKKANSKDTDNKLITPDDVSSLTDYAGDVIIWLINKRGEFNAKSDIAKWIETQKFSPKLDLVTVNQR